MWILLLACAHAPTPPAEVKGPPRSSYPMTYWQPATPEIVGAGEPLEIAFDWPEAGRWSVLERVSTQSFGHSASEQTLAVRYEISSHKRSFGLSLASSEPTVIEGDARSLAAGLLANPPTRMLDERGAFIGLMEPQATGELLLLWMTPLLDELEASQGAQARARYEQALAPSFHPSALEVSAGNQWRAGMGLLLSESFVVGQERTVLYDTVLPGSAAVVPTTARIRVLGERACGERECVAISLVAELEPEANRAALEQAMRGALAEISLATGHVPVVSQASRVITSHYLLFADTGVPYSQAIMTETSSRIRMGEQLEDLHQIEVRTLEWTPILDPAQ